MLSTVAKRIPDLALLGLLMGTALLLAHWAYTRPYTATLTMDTLPALLPRNGLYDEEQFPDRSSSYRWTNGSGTLKIPNPGGPVALQIVMAGGPGRTVHTQIQLATSIFSITVEPEPHIYMLLLPAMKGERISIQINSPSFRVASRDLGVVISDLKIAGGGTAPAAVTLALLVATLGIYLLLRQIGWRRRWASTVVILMQALALAWQSAGYWRYGNWGTIMLLAGGGCLAAVASERWLPRRPPPTDATSIAWSRYDGWAVAALIVVALCVRLPWLAAPDPVGDLELSARRLQALSADGLAGAYTGGGDYMPLRLYWLQGLSMLVPLFGGDYASPTPAATRALIKLPGLLADLATVALIYLYCRRWRPVRRAAAVAALYTLAPPIWINVAWWGQIDAILMLPLVGAVVLLDRADGRWSWMCWATALLIKPQAIILAPLLYAATLRRHGSRGLARGGALAIGLLAIGVAPLVLAGQAPGLVQAYIGSVGRFPDITSSAYNLWYLVTWGASGPDTSLALGPLSFRVLGLTLMGCATMLVFVALLVRANEQAYTEGAAVLMLGFFLLPTQIHERYLFLSLAFLILCVARNERMVVPYLILVATATLNIFGALRGFLPAAHAIIDASPLPLAIAAVNILVFFGLLGHLLSLCVQRPLFTPAPLIDADSI